MSNKKDNWIEVLATILIWVMLVLVLISTGMNLEQRDKIESLNNAIFAKNEYPVTEELKARIKHIERALGNNDEEDFNLNVYGDSIEFKKLNAIYEYLGIEWNEGWVEKK